MPLDFNSWNNSGSGRDLHWTAAGARRISSTLSQSMGSLERFCDTLSYPPFQRLNTSNWDLCVRTFRSSVVSHGIPYEFSLFWIDGLDGGMIFESVLCYFCTEIEWHAQINPLGDFLDHESYRFWWQGSIPKVEVLRSFLAQVTEDSQYQNIHVMLLREYPNETHTVDGWNPAPPGMYKAL